MPKRTKGGAQKKPNGTTTAPEQAETSTSKPEQTETGTSKENDTEMRTSKPEQTEMSASDTDETEDSTSDADQNEESTPGKNERKTKQILTSINPHRIGTCNIEVLLGMTVLDYTHLSVPAIDQSSRCNRVWWSKLNSFMLFRTTALQASISQQNALFTENKSRIAEMCGLLTRVLPIQMKFTPPTVGNVNRECFERAMSGQLMNGIMRPEMFINVVASDAISSSNSQFLLEQTPILKIASVLAALRISHLGILMR